MDTMTERTAGQTVWLASPWSLSLLEVRQTIQSVAFGAPEGASVAGRTAVDDFGDDLEALADS